MIYLPSVVIITYYFKRRLAFASGVASCGGGIGTFAFAPIMQLLGDEYGWEYTLVILGLIIIFCFPLGALCKPLKSTQTMVCETEKRMKENNWQALMKYCKGIFLSMARNGKQIFYLLMDAKCSIFMLSNFFTCLGAIAPFIFTVVRVI